MQKILFTSVVGPHGVDTPHSRYKNPMSLLSNQVTRGQKYYTVQMCSRTFAFDLFGTNINANVAILDFPLQEHLEKALRATNWDRVGVAGIMANFEKILLTYKIIRSIRPDVPIDIGGHIANEPEVIAEFTNRILEINPQETIRVWPSTKDSGSKTGVTFILQEGLEYYANMPGVGLKTPDKIAAPLVTGTFDKRAFGIPIPSTSSGLIIPDVGCPKKCNFCCTSHKFDGRFVKFLDSAEDIMTVANAQGDLGRDEMLVMSENFSLDTNRALKLLKLMEQQKRPHRFSVFSSADALVKLGIENIVKLGYSWVWIGLEESSGGSYKNKLNGIDIRALIKTLQEHGIEVLGSTILGFEHQKVEDLDREIKHSLSLGCDYNQFMLFMAMPGTMLWREMKAKGVMKKNFPWLDIHGQDVQNWHHPHITDEQITAKLDEAFDLDFVKLGPSLFRMMKTCFQGYLKTADWDHELVQMRRASNRKKLFWYLPPLTAMARDLKAMGHSCANEAWELREAIAKELGWTARLNSLLMAPIMSAAMRMERYRHNRSVRLRQKENPRVLLTHYGDFTHSYPKGMPKVEPGAPFVSVARPQGKQTSADCSFNCSTARDTSVSASL